MQQLLDKIKTRNVSSSAGVDDQVAMLQAKVKQLESENRRLQTLAMQSNL